jgi:hypothetical protein
MHGNQDFIHAAVGAIVLLADFAIKHTALLIAALLALTFGFWAPRR